MGECSASYDVPDEREPVLITPEPLLEDDPLSISEVNPTAAEEAMSVLEESVKPECPAEVSTIYH